MGPLACFASHSGAFICRAVVNVEVLATVQSCFTSDTFDIVIGEVGRDGAEVGVAVGD